MPKVKKTKKSEDTEEKVLGGDIKEEEETEKEGGALSDGVLDAFDEVAPIDPLLEDETLPLEDEEDDELDSGDYRANDEW